MGVNKVIINRDGVDDVLIDISDSTVTPETLNQGVIAYDKSGAKITGTIPNVTQATPSISVNSSGLITASVTQSAGNVAGGTKSATKQLTTKGGTTITPGTSEQTAVSAGTYVTGDIKVAGVTPGKQVVTGTATQSYNAASRKATLSFAPGFNPTYALLVCVTANSRGQYIMLKNGTWTSVVTYSSSNITYTATYSNGTVTLSTSSGSSNMNGTYQWVAYA